MVLLDDPAAPAFGGVVFTANAVLNATLSGIGFGLLIGVGVNVNVTIQGWLLDGVEFSGGIAFANQTSTAFGPSLPANPTQFGVVFDEVPTFDFQFGPYENVTLFALLNFGRSIEFDMGPLFGDVQPFHFRQQLSATMGTVADAQRESYEVEFA